MSATIQKKSSAPQKKFKVLHLNQAIEFMLTELSNVRVCDVITRDAADNNSNSKRIQDTKNDQQMQVLERDSFNKIKFDQKNYAAIYQSWKEDILDYSFKSSKISPDVYFPNGKIKFIKFERKKGNKRSFKCPFDNCFKFFAESGNLRTHLRTHTGSRPFICHQCNKTFITKGHLISHELTHSGERPFVCTYQGCDKSYSRSGRLKIHMRSHTGEKPYKCEFQNCSKSFTERGNLKTHMRIHIGIKPHECNICGKKFVTNGHLKDHVKTHSNDNIKNEEVDRLKKEIISQESEEDEEEEEGEEEEEEKNFDYEEQEKQPDEDVDDDDDKRIVNDQQEQLEEEKNQNIGKVKRLGKTRKKTKNRNSISKSIKQSNKKLIYPLNNAGYIEQQIPSKSVSQQKTPRSQQCSDKSPPNVHQNSVKLKSKFITHTMNQQLAMNDQPQCYTFQPNSRFAKINQSEQKRPLLTKAQQELIKLRRETSKDRGSNSNQQFLPPLSSSYISKPLDSMAQFHSDKINQFTPQSNSFNFYSTFFPTNFANASNNLLSTLKFHSLFPGNEYQDTNSPFNPNTNMFIPQTPLQINSNFGNSQTTHSQFNLINQELWLQAMQARGITSLTPPPQLTQQQQPSGNIGFSSAFQNYLTSQNPSSNKASVSPNEGMRNLSQISLPFLFSTPKGPGNNFYPQPGLNNLSAFKQIIPPNTNQRPQQDNIGNNGMLAFVQNQNKITSNNLGYNGQNNKMTIPTPSNFNNGKSSSSPVDLGIDSNSFSNCLMRNNNFVMGYVQNKGNYNNSAAATPAPKINLFSDMTSTQQQQHNQSQQQIFTPHQQQQQKILTPFGGNSVINIQNKFHGTNSNTSNQHSQAAQVVHNFASDHSKGGNSTNKQSLSNGGNNNNNNTNKVESTFQEMSKYVTQVIQAEEKIKQM